jgi:hypothetical protein
MSNPEQSPEPPKKIPQKFTIDVSKDLEAIYANVAFMRYGLGEMIFDFGQVLPATNRGKVLSRVIMSPVHAKMLHVALGQQVAKYELQFGEIRLPSATDLPSQFFRFPPSDQDKE